LKFDTFDLDSYGKGDLDFALLPRELVTETLQERIEAAEAFERLTTPTGWSMAGKDLEEIYGENPPAKLPPLVEQKDQSAAEEPTLEGTFGQQMREFNAGQRTGGIAGGQ
jgi:hypothetical protein